MLQVPAAAWHTLVGVAQGYVVAQIIRIVAFGGASFRHIPGHGSRHVAMCRAPKGRAEERRQIQKRDEHFVVSDAIIDGRSGGMWVDVFPHGLRAVQSVRTIEISVRIMQPGRDRGEGGRNKVAGCKEQRRPQQRSSHPTTSSAR